VSVLLILGTVMTLCAMVAWIAYLRFCRWLVERTGDPKALRDAAVAARAFPLKPEVKPWRSKVKEG
jgi:hypothetical protein